MDSEGLFSPEIALPSPEFTGGVSIEEALVMRRSERSYSDRQLSLEDVSQLLWAAQGVTSSMGFRTAPSAGALYPLEIYLVAGNVRGLDPGVYRYVPEGHSLVLTAEGDRRKELSEVSLSQPQIKNAAADIVIAAEYSRTMIKYGDRGIRYAHIEVGFAAQNVYLQAIPLGIGTCAVGAFYDDDVADDIGLQSSEKPLLILPIGYV
ncbi:SagB/ThcOx family dehydrogenase [Methanolobus sp. ZRKC3]|uniref:SagB/ThcOx family dehydrogenase n=1 Tax=Methanolobus sp. ZRKC3 TaxID=3125786 RepID=UPI003249F8F4